MTDNDVKIIGRSNTTMPKEKTDSEILKEFCAYNSKRSWRGSSCYYQFYSSRGTTDFLGYKHNPTGVIFMLYAKRSDAIGKRSFRLNGTESLFIQWRDPADCTGFEEMQAEMDAIDSKRKNWDIVKLNVKQKFVDRFSDFYILDNSNYTAKGDFSPIMEVTEVLQKGCKVIKQQTQAKKEQPIQQLNTIQEMII
ncbi:MAG: hypothetical protein CMI60_09045 [Parvibaculum sp.]|nr:hypothetical protein [Parvibaculum sp.]|tara:strand:- start:546 stop:1127 length:582 start_codon:yes stop_codon:yes gene_type:complete